MCDRLIAYFANRHLLCNLLFTAVLIGAVVAWNHTPKEEMPAITFDTVRVSVRYPGAPAQDVEYFVTRPMEEELRAIDGVFRITSASSVGQANITVELEQDLSNLDEVVTEIRGAVLDVPLPLEVIDEPSVRVFKTSKKAILDIALIDTGVHLLDVESRRRLQQYAFALETQLLNMPEVDSVNRSNYLQEEIQIQAYPERLDRFDIPFNTVMRDIKDNHVRQPAGTLEAKREPKVTLLSELDTPEKLREFIIQGGFEGQVIRLGEVAEVVGGYEKTETILKVNGHETVMLNVVKSGHVGILKALDAVTAAVERFRRNNLTGTSLQAVLLDDESIDVRNRIHLIGTNGALGFALIVLTLFVLLDKRSGIWVAMGLPFTFGFTMIVGSLMGYTINGTTLAAVIIVMGIVVDDAIVVAENITRLLQQGMERSKAIVQGTSFVMLPVIASVATTCVAFVPLFFFEGRFGKIIEFIPPVIFLMLGASLLESLIILPGHMGLEPPWFVRRWRRLRHKPKLTAADTEGAGLHWFDAVEARYERALARLLSRKGRVVGVFAAVLALAAVIAATQMKFVMFPNEETRDITIMGRTPPESTRYDTALMARQIEDIIAPYIGKEVVGLRTNVARSRRGGAVEDNQFRVSVEVVPREKRRKSSDQLIAEWRKPIEALEGFSDLSFSKSRWGQESGSALELLVQQNNDQARHEIVQWLAEKMRAHPDLKSVEIDEGLMVPEYRIRIDREKIKRLAISPSDVASTFRAALEGTVLYEFSTGDEEVRVRLTTVDAAKDDIKKVLAIPVENQRNYLVPLGDIVHVEEVTSPNAISRRDLKRTTQIYADLRKGARMTPVEAAEYFEREVFPEALSKHPTTTLTFVGEVLDTRESGRDLWNATILALLLIYFILAVLLNSLFKPFIIMLSVPFGAAGVILAFALHGKLLIGFYAAVGLLGLAGVVINDSIVLLVKFEEALDKALSGEQANAQIARIARTRLRAVLLTTITTVAGVLPTAYGIAGYDDMLGEMMLALAWGLAFGTLITLVLVPCVYSFGQDLRHRVRRTEERLKARMGEVAHA